MAYGPYPRVLHITDLHLIARPDGTVYGADPFDSLRAVLDAARSLYAPPDLVIATGDLSEDATPRSYRWLRDIFREAGLPVLVVPGNHDDPAAMQESLLCDLIGWVPEVVLGRWSIVLLDSRVPGKSCGFLAESQLELLASIGRGEPPWYGERPVLVCLHHGPVSDCPAEACQLQNAAELLDLVASCPDVRAVISGHAHVAAERRFQHAKLLTTPSTCSQVKHPRPGQPVDEADFWASHTFDPGRRGFRMLTLRPGELASKVHWLPGEPVARRG